jgi:hypothetical protein
VDDLCYNMLMFVVLWWLIMLQVKSYGVMVKNLNLQSGGERFLQLGITFFLTYIAYYKFVFSLRVAKLSS